MRRGGDAGNSRSRSRRAPHRESIVAAAAAAAAITAVIGAAGWRGSASLGPRAFQIVVRGPEQASDICEERVKYGSLDLAAAGRGPPLELGVEA